jgi:uncharacterized protein YdcH (DUF465 family)
MTPEDIRSAGMDRLIERHTELDKFVYDVEGIYLRAARIELTSVLLEKRTVERQMILKGRGK